MYISLKYMGQLQLFLTVRTKKGGSIGNIYFLYYSRATFCETIVLFSSIYIKFLLKISILAISIAKIFNIIFVFLIKLIKSNLFNLLTVFLGFILLLNKISLQ